MNDRKREPWAIRLSAQRRLAIVVAVGIAVYSIGPTVVPIANRLLVTWIAASLTYLVLYWLTILHADADLTRRRASTYDQAAYVIFLLVTNAACASIVAIGFVMGDVKSMDFWPKALHVGLSIAALLLSWMLIQTVFAFHYARRYYAPASVREGPAAGLNFPGVAEARLLRFRVLLVRPGHDVTGFGCRGHDRADAAHDAGPQHPQLRFQHCRARNEHQCHRRRHLESAEPTPNAFRRPKSDRIPTVSSGLGTA